MEHEPPKSYARIWLALVLLIAYTVVVLMATMSPFPVDQGYQGAIARLLAAAHQHGLPGWFGYSALQFTANIAMFVPLGFLVALALPRRIWWLALLIVPAFSIAIELTQGRFLPHRFEDAGDVLSNTIGGYLGAGIALGLRMIMRMRDRTVIRRAIWEHEQRSNRFDSHVESDA